MVNWFYNIFIEDTAIYKATILLSGGMFALGMERNDYKLFLGGCGVIIAGYVLDTWREHARIERAVTSKPNKLERNIDTYGN